MKISLGITWANETHPGNRERVVSGTLPDGRVVVSNGWSAILLPAGSEAPVLEPLPATTTAAIEPLLTGGVAADLEAITKVVRNAHPRLKRPWKGGPKCSACKGEGSVAAACSACKGEGSVAAACSSCKGSGVVECDMGHEHPCDDCDPDNADWCPACEGTGKMRPPDTLVRIGGLHFATWMLVDLLALAPSLKGGRAFVGPNTLRIEFPWGKYVQMRVEPGSAPVSGVVEVAA